MDDRVKLNQALDRLRAASLDASAGTAYVCGAPWFRNGSGVLLGSPDPHAGRMIADTDTSLSEPDDHNEIDDDCNALFLAEAWNFARMILGSPELLDRLRASDTGRSEAEAYEQAESKIFARRFGSLHAKPCRDPNVATCARYECQFAGSCQKAEARAALHPPAGQGERKSDG